MPFPNVSSNINTMDYFLRGVEAVKPSFAPGAVLSTKDINKLPTAQRQKIKAET